LGYWGDRARPAIHLFLVPNALEPQWLQRGARQRKSGSLRGSRPSTAGAGAQSVPMCWIGSPPALRGRVPAGGGQRGWVEDLVPSWCIWLHRGALRLRRLTGAGGRQRGFRLCRRWRALAAAGCVPVFQQPSTMAWLTVSILLPRPSDRLRDTRSRSGRRIEAAVADPSRLPLPQPARLKALLETCSEPRRCARRCSGLDGDRMPIGTAILLGSALLCAQLPCGDCGWNAGPGAAKALACLGARKWWPSPHRVGLKRLSPSGD